MYAINSILYQRGIYPPERSRVNIEFKSIQKYGIHLLVSTETAVMDYLNHFLSQVTSIYFYLDWISLGKIKRLVMVIMTKETGLVCERWQFDIQLHTAQTLEKQMNAEIAAIIRQITASVSFLPILDESSIRFNLVTWNILAYTDKDAPVPTEWVDSDAKLITKNAEKVQLRSFSTNDYKVGGMVSYRMDDE